MNNENNKELKGLLERINKDSKRVLELTGNIVPEVKVKTKVEFDAILNEFVSTASMKTRIMQGEREMKQSEIYWFEDRGIPYDAWKDIAWFRQLLK